MTTTAEATHSFPALQTSGHAGDVVPLGVMRVTIEDPYELRVTIED